MFVPNELPAPMASVLAEVRSWVERAPVAQTPEERAAWLAGLRQVADATESVFTQTLAAFDANGDGETLHAASSSTSWLRGALRLASGDASERVRLARGSRDLLADPVDALTAGEVTYDQVRAIERAVRVIPEHQREDAVTVLTDLAKQADVQAVRVAGQRLRFVTDPDGSLSASEKEFERRYLNLSPLLDGMTALDGLLDPESATMLNTALSPFLVPAGKEDKRSASQRRADGLVELARTGCDHSLLPEIAGQRPHLDVLCPLETLVPDVSTSSAGPEPARLPSAPSGGLITSIAVKRIACDADIARVLMGPDSIPVDIGRRQRLFTFHQRRAMSLRDGGCRFPDCHRPPAYTDAHHILSWLDGGPTDLCNGCLLCRFHHRLVHEGGWRIRVHDPARGSNALLTFIGPADQHLPSLPRGP